MRNQLHNRPHARWYLPLIGVVLIGLLSPTAQSQDFKRFEPKVPPNQEGESRLPSTPKEAAGDTTILVDELKSLIFVDHPSQVAAQPIAPEWIQIRSQGLQILNSDAFKEQMLPYLGQPISMRMLNEIVRTTIIYYRNNDQPVVDISIPQQRITEGVVQVVVTEGRVGQVYIDGARYFSPRRLASQVHVYPGDAIHETTLMGDLYWLNRNPFRKVDLEIAKGEQYGLTDIIFKVDDQFPVRAYLGYENTGTRQTDYDRMLMGITWGNVFGLDHQLGFQYTTSPDFETLEAYSGSYEIAMDNHDSIQIFGSFAEINTSAGPSFGLTGTAWQISGRYNYDLCSVCDFKHHLVFGFDFKQTNTNLGFGGSTVFASRADIGQWVFGWRGSRADEFGALSLSTDLVIGPGAGFSSNSNNAAFSTIRNGARANYVYGRMIIEEQYYLPWDLTLLLRATGQLADGNLLPSEQLGFGGYDSIRGYDMRLINGDSGVFANAELRTNPFSPGLFGSCDQLQLYTFYDVGDARNHSLLPGEDPSVDLSSVGGGLTYSLTRYFQARVEYGWRLNSVGIANVPNSRWHVGVVASY